MKAYGSATTEVLPKKAQHRDSQIILIIVINGRLRKMNFLTKFLKHGLDARALTLTILSAYQIEIGLSGMGRKLRDGEQIRMRVASIDLRM